MDWNIWLIFFQIFDAFKDLKKAIYTGNHKLPHIFSTVVNIKHHHYTGLSQNGGKLPKLGRLSPRHPTCSWVHLGNSRCWFYFIIATVVFGRFLLVCPLRSSIHVFWLSESLVGWELLLLLNFVSCSPLQCFINHSSWVTSLCFKRWKCDIFSTSSLVAGNMCFMASRMPGSCLFRHSMYLAIV